MSDTMAQNDEHMNSAALWAGVFASVEENDIQKTIMRERLQVRRDDILTAKLRTTVEFYKAVEAKTFPVLPGGIENLGRVLDIFCVLCTFDNLASAGYSDLAKPAFWVRTGETRRDITAAIPVDAAATICGISSSFLRASLVPMIKDGAVEFIRSPSGVAAIMVKPGFVNDMGFRRYLMS